MYGRFHNSAEKLFYILAGHSIWRKLRELLNCFILCVPASPRDPTSIISHNLLVFSDDISASCKLGKLPEDKVRRKVSWTFRFPPMLCDTPSCKTDML